MCLQAVHTTYDKPQAGIHVGYKVMRPKGRARWGHEMYYSGKLLVQGEWRTNRHHGKIYMDEGGKYDAGFHVFTTPEAVWSYGGHYSYGRLVVVFYTNVTVEGRQCNGTPAHDTDCVIAQKIMVVGRLYDMSQRTINRKLKTVIAEAKAKRNHRR